MPAIACYSYGLQPGSRAMTVASAAKWMPAAAAPTRPMCRPRTVVYTPNPAPYTAAGPAAAPAGVQAFRDEYGFRYDGQGNRLDARGNIISPQSTRP